MFPPRHWWCCGLAQGTMLHIWWDFPVLCPFWDSIFSLYNSLTGSYIPTSPSLGLLSMLPGSISSLKKEAPHTFPNGSSNFYSETLEVLWPTLREWVSELDHLRRMEKLMVDNSGRSSTCMRTWSVCVLFEDHPAFAQWLASGTLPWFPNPLPSSFLLFLPLPCFFFTFFIFL